MFNLQIWKLTFDAEYMKAISREKNFTDDKAYKESAWFLVRLHFRLQNLWNWRPGMKASMMTEMPTRMAH